MLKILVKQAETIPAEGLRICAESICLSLGEQQRNITYPSYCYQTANYMSNKARR